MVKIAEFACSPIWASETRSEIRHGAGIQRTRATNLPRSCLRQASTRGSAGRIEVFPPLYRQRTWLCPEIFSMLRGFWQIRLDEGVLWWLIISLTCKRGIADRWKSQPSLVRNFGVWCPGAGPRSHPGSLGLPITVVAIRVAITSSCWQVEPMPSTLLKNQPATDFAEATTDFYVPPRDLGCCFPSEFSRQQSAGGWPNVVEKLVTKLGPWSQGLSRFGRSRMWHFRHGLGMKQLRRRISGPSSFCA